MHGFDHILNWRLLRGSHAFPGPEGGTCINEAAVVACGLPYRPIGSVADMPACFSRPVCQLAMRLNDDASDAERRRLMPFVTRLACADTPAVERDRAAYIRQHTPPWRLLFGFGDMDWGCAVLEGALAIGRRADPVGRTEAASRLSASREPFDRATRDDAPAYWMALLTA